MPVLREGPEALEAPGGPGTGGHGGFRGGFGSGIRSRGCGCARGAHRRKAEDKEWLPVTKLGRLVKDMKIKPLEEIYLFSLPFKESEIIDFFLGTGIVSALVPKKLLMMAGIDDCYTSARGCTATLGNFAKATFDAISKTYSYLTPDIWKETVFTKSPYQEFTDHLVKTHTRVSVQRIQAPAVATT
ncbi:40S ribosomal protein S2 [Camelus dromedarius]|uniref:Small ribosomal subunit protein uS5 n=1 Tax=Camelus dromedarius TaxID=9838 RepID=A0A5N4DAJ5_CAMDR|nr:40S ribosomal protein S2 [Camelus dromedarius]